MNLMTPRHLGCYELDSKVDRIRLHKTAHYLAVHPLSENISHQHNVHIEDVAEHSTEIDALTGLPDQSGFNKKLNLMMRECQIKLDESFGLILFDFDYFNQINSNHGHLVGDQILKTLAERVQRVLPQEVFFTRLGSDEFALLIPHIHSDAYLIETYALIHQEISRPIEYLDQIIESNISAGCAIYPRDVTDTMNVVQAANIALCRLKLSGRGGYCIFKREMQIEQNVIAQQFNCARYILRHNLICPFYQPKFNLKNGQLTGFEALLRWYDQHDQLQLPRRIKNAFEDYNLASRLSEIMQLRVFRDMAEWIDQGLDMVPVSINAAPVEFLKDNYAELLLDRLDRFNIPHSLVEIEITEHLLDEHGKAYISRALNKLKHEGIRIALDDFGTGHSSLTRLANLPVDCLKIDCDFVQRMEQEKLIFAIVQSIISMSSNLGIDVVAEGIENVHQLELLKQQGCEIGQGFLFSHALAPAEAKALLS